LKLEHGLLTNGERGFRFQLSLPTFYPHTDFAFNNPNQNLVLKLSVAVVLDDPPWAPSSSQLSNALCLAAPAALS
jgi:hypothetical protein